MAFLTHFGIFVKSTAATEAAVVVDSVVLLATVVVEFAVVMLSEVGVVVVSLAVEGVEVAVGMVTTLTLL